LAEAKLSLTDATFDQIDATGELKDQQELLNDAINGASDGTKAYGLALIEVNEAKKKQAEANERVADAIDREAEAQERLNDANEKQGELAKLYPKIAANNPMAEFTGSVASTSTGNPFTGTFPQDSGQMVINVNAGLISSPDQVAQEIQDILNRRARNNGGNPFTGTFG
jgi:hypothetical protein